MKEQEPRKERKDRLNVVERKTFLPFGDSTEFLQADLTNAYNEQIAVAVLVSEIEFKGIKGEISVLSDPTSEFEFITTPLGSARKIFNYTNDEITVSEAPCYISLSFEVKNQKEYDILDDYSAEVYLGNKEFFFDCSGGEDPEYIFHELQRGKKLMVQDINLKNDEYEVGEVVLPYNLGALKGIGVKFVKNDEDYEDDQIPLDSSSDPFSFLRNG